MGLLIRCPQCGATIPKDSPCPNCGFSENLEQQHVICKEYHRRKRNHRIGSAAHMASIFGFALPFALTAFFLGTRLGSTLLKELLLLPGRELLILAVIALGPLMAVVGRVIYRMYGIGLHCPSCNIRLDELGMKSDTCPGCNTKLY